jgi:hypothetical protein
MPNHMPLDWDWRVRIGTFGDSDSFDAPRLIGYRALECHDGTSRYASHVFEFGRILIEILAHVPGGCEAVADLVPRRDRGRAAGDSGLCGSSSSGADHRLLEGLSDVRRKRFRLVYMEFKVAASANSANVAMFVRRIEEWEWQKAWNELTAKEMKMAFGELFIGSTHFFRFARYTSISF